MICCVHIMALVQYTDKCRATVQISDKVNACCMCVLRVRVNTFADSDGKRGYTYKIFQWILYGSVHCAVINREYLPLWNCYNSNTVGIV